MSLTPQFYVTSGYQQARSGIKRRVEHQLEWNLCHGLHLPLSWLWCSRAAHYNQDTTLVKMSFWVIPCDMVVAVVHSPSQAAVVWHHQIQYRKWSWVGSHPRQGRTLNQTLPHEPGHHNDTVGQPDEKTRTKRFRRHLLSLGQEHPL